MMLLVLDSRLLSKLPVRERLLRLLDEKVLSGEISPSMARAELDALFDFVQMDANIQKEKTLVAKSKLKKRGSL